MPTAAGIIMATGAMTIANDAIQGNQPLTTVVDKINWKVIPATVVAAGIFYALEQMNAPMAKGFAALAFLTAFIGGDSYFNVNANKTSPLGTLLNTFGYKVPTAKGFLPGQTVGGIPYS